MPVLAQALEAKQGRKAPPEGCDIVVRIDAGEPARDRVVA